ncbi:MAG: acyl-CoA thioesterase II [Pseudomonadota bacterium]
MSQDLTRGNEPGKSAGDSNKLSASVHNYARGDVPAYVKENNEQALRDLLEILALTPVATQPATRDPDQPGRPSYPITTFSGRSINTTWMRIFGGQVIAQALRAASMTVEAARPCHSMHAYFMRPGDPSAPLVFDTAHLRDGKSFTTRQVNVAQHGETIFTATCSYQTVQDGISHVAAAMPDVATPDQLPGPDDLTDAQKERIAPHMLAYWNRPRPFEIRFASLDRLSSDRSAETTQHLWVKACCAFPDETVLHQTLLAYASDFTLLDTALSAHGRPMFDAQMQMASLDHAMWFHAPVRMDDWLLLAQASPWSGMARGLGLGHVFDRAGTLVATVGQEGLLRVKRS